MPSGPEPTPWRAAVWVFDSPHDGTRYCVARDNPTAHSGKEFALDHRGAVVTYGTEPAAQSLADRLNAGQTY